MQEPSRGQRGTCEQAKDPRLPYVQKSKTGFKVATGVQKKEALAQWLLHHFS